MPLYSFLFLQNCSLPVIANGGSSNNRNSEMNTYEGIRKFWKETGASSIMIARGAEWNPSIFRKEGPVDFMAVKFGPTKFSFEQNFCCF